VEPATDNVATPSGLDTVNIYTPSFTSQLCLVVVVVVICCEAKQQVALWVKKVGDRMLQFSDRQQLISDRVDIKDAQNFNFAPKFSQNEAFLASNLVFLDKDFPTKRKISDRLKLGRNRGSSSRYD